MVAFPVSCDLKGPEDLSPYKLSLFRPFIGVGEPFLAFFEGRQSCLFISLLFLANRLPACDPKREFLERRPLATTDVLVNVSFGLETKSFNLFFVLYPDLTLQCGDTIRSLHGCFLLALSSDVQPPFSELVTIFRCERLRGS